MKIIAGPLTHLDEQRQDIRLAVLTMTGVMTTVTVGSEFVLFALGVSKVHLDGCN
jgi:hypothetical protein